MQFKKIFPLFILIASAAFCCGAEGELYQLKTPLDRSKLQGSAQIAAAATLFRYTPATGKQGVLDTLFLQDHALSDDQTLLALAESQEQDGKYLNRIVFFDFKNFQFINGIEKTADRKIDKIFFFGDLLVCLSDKELQYIKLGKNPKFSAKKIVLPDPINHFFIFSGNLYIKCRNKSLLKINSHFDIIADFATRDDAGVIFVLPDSRTIVNFTDDNIEKIHDLKDGFFRMDFTGLKDVPAPKNILPSKNPSSSLFFLSDKNELVQLINFSYTEKIDLPDFEQIALRSQKEEIFLLASKKYSLEIFTIPDFTSRKRIAHNTMRPKTDRNLKFVIPHSEGVMLITQKGEFVFIREYKRRLYKEIIQ